MDPNYVRVEQSERLALTDKLGELARISLGEHEGRWFFSLGHQQRTGDMWGSGGPLGYHRDRDTGFPDRDAALAGAIEHARKWWSGREAEMAPHFAWLDTLIPEQPDLF